MRRSNPSVIARNHRVEAALGAADKGDLSVMENLLGVLANPFDDSPAHQEYSTPAGAEFAGYKTFCGT
jgi:uncharacterized protein YdiU (UPF0061 family)